MKTHITKLNICTFPSVVRLQQNSELSNKFLISIGTNINILPMKTHDKMAKHFSTFRTLRSNEEEEFIPKQISSDEQKLIQQLRTEKHELYNECMDNGSEIFYLLSKKKKLCLAVKDKISTFYEPSEDSKNDEISSLTDYHINKNKELRSKLTDVLKRNNFKPST